MTTAHAPSTTHGERHDRDGRDDRATDVTGPDAEVDPGAGARSVAMLRAEVGAPAAGGAQVDAAVSQAAASPVVDLPHRDSIQRSFGPHDVGGVRAHVGGQAGDAAQSLGAVAFASGDDVAFGSSPDLHTAAHEAAHVVQQRQGDVGFSGVGPADGPHERLADRAADAVVAGVSAAPILDAGGAPRSGSEGAVQLQRAADDSDGDAHNAYMTARAYDDAGRLLDMWAGPAFFHGEMPAAFQAKQRRDRWKWTRDGVADASGAKLKVDSDREGEAGVPVGDWAPAGAAVITVSFRGLAQPFGAKIVVDPDAPLSMIGALEGGVADGAEPADLDAPGVFHGPREPGSVHESGDLQIEQTEKGTRFWLGSSMMDIKRKQPSDDYAYTVQAQTSPNQRVIDVVGTPAVDVYLDNHAEGAQLVYHLRHVPPGEVPAQHPEALFAEGVMPAITALGDDVRCMIMMGDDRIHIEAVEPEARFAYYVDPEWSGEHGEERTVHIVATTGVRVDEFKSGGDADDGRTLLASPIYVQDPARVPKQGMPITPSDYLGAEQLAYGRADNEKLAVYTGSQGVTLRDAYLGLAVTIELDDPAVGGRFAWDLEKPDGGARGAFRALIGPGVRVHVVEAREARPGEPALDGDGFGVAIDLRTVSEPSLIPPQGTPLTADLVGAFPERAPDSVTYQDPISDEERLRMAAADLLIGMLPGSEGIDLLEALGGEDKWGNELSTLERVVIGLAVLIPFLPGAVAKVGRFAKGTLRGTSELAELAARLGKSTDEVEYLLSRLRTLDPDAQAAARRVEEALKRGDLADPADLRLVNDALGGAGLGRVATEPGSGQLDVIAGDADVVTRIDVDTPGADDLGGVRGKGTNVEAGGGKRRGRGRDVDEDAPPTRGVDPDRPREVDGPHQDPREFPDQPRKALDKKELEPVRKLGLKDSWSAAQKVLDRGESAPLGRRLDVAKHGHEVIERLARGDASALERLGIDDYPKGLDSTAREWALVEARDGFVVFAGAHDSVNLPNGVRILAHNHPSPSSAAKEAGAHTARELPAHDAAVGIEYTKVISDKVAASEAGIIPSVRDIHAISDGVDHVIYTRYVHRGEGRIAEPAAGDAGARVSLHLSGTRVVRWHKRSKEYWYETTMSVQDSSGVVIWQGPLYARWRSQVPSGNVYLQKPADLERSAGNGWEDFP